MIHLFTCTRVTTPSQQYVIFLKFLFTKMTCCHQIKEHNHSPSACSPVLLHLCVFMNDCWKPLFSLQFVLLHPNRPLENPGLQVFCSLPKLMKCSICIISSCECVRAFFCFWWPLTLILTAVAELKRLTLLSRNGSSSSRLMYCRTVRMAEGR